MCVSRPVVCRPLLLSPVILALWARATNARAHLRLTTVFRARAESVSRRPVEGENSFLPSFIASLLPFSPRSVGPTEDRALNVVCPLSLSLSWPPVIQDPSEARFAGGSLKSRYKNTVVLEFPCRTSKSRSPVKSAARARARERANARGPFRHPVAPSSASLSHAHALSLSFFSRWRQWWGLEFGIPDFSRARSS